MASHCRPSKRDKSSIKYWWIPLEVQSFEPAIIWPEEDVHASSFYHRKSSSKSESKSSNNIISTAKVISAVGGIWDCVGQPAVFQTKKILKYDDICQKENTIPYSDSKKKLQVPTSADPEYFCYDLKSASSFSPTVKSNFENLETIKKMLLFGSRNGNITKSFIWREVPVSDPHLSVDCCGINQVASVGASNDLAHIYGSITGKPFYGLKDLVEFFRTDCNRTAESCIIGKENPPAGLSSIRSAENKVTTGCEDSSGDEAVNLVENVMHTPSSLCSTYSLQTITSTEEPVIVLRSLSSGLHSDYKSDILTSTEFGKCPEAMDSCGIIVEPSVELSASENQNMHRNCKSLLHELALEEEYSPEPWVLIQDRIQNAFAKNRHALAGALAGTLVSLCLHPVDTVKTIIQAHGMCQKSSYQILKTILSERGVMGLYRGIASNIASSAPISAIYTFTYESVKGSMLPILPKEYHSFAHCFAGGCSSIATSFIFTPSERIKQQMQVGSQYQNCWSALIGCLEKGGVASLYAGWGAVLCRNIPHSIIKFYTYERLKQLLLTSTKPDASLNTLQTLVCGGLAGSTAALFTTPFDVVKTRLQTQAPGSLGKYNGVLHALQEIAKHEGVKGLYRGLTPRLAMYVSQGAIFFASYEFLKAVFTLEAPARVIEKKQVAEYDSTSSRVHKLHT